jgi:hypothetical protein
LPVHQLRLPAGYDGACGQMCERFLLLSKTGHRHAILSV